MSSASSSPPPPAFELNLDGLIGPTHSYAGLSHGNLASERNRRDVSHPRQAALQGLAKMKRLADLGIPQAVLPPQERPDVGALRRLGFTGSDANVLDEARRRDPVLLAGCCSASSMWAANAATVSPSADAADRRVHFTPANLVTQFHRSLEPPATAASLRAIFADESAFVHHDPLPAAAAFSDEGAANHTRLCPGYGEPGIEIFVYGRSALDSSRALPSRFPARQTLEASAAIARLHRLDPDRVFFVQQNPAAIDAGAFHNDVVAVGNLNVLLYHERAFSDSDAIAARLRGAYLQICGTELSMIEVSEDEVSLESAIGSYLFNSQLVRLPDGSMLLIAPTECQEDPAASEFLANLPGRGTPIRAVEFVDVRQSMKNGGGPACLRLRVAVTGAELAKVHRGVILTDELYEQLASWVERHYRGDLRAEDLGDPKLLEESRAALDALTKILQIGSIYRFQRE